MLKLEPKGYLYYGVLLMMAGWDLLEFPLSVLGVLGGFLCFLWAITLFEKVTDKES